MELIGARGLVTLGSCAETSDNSITSSPPPARRRSTTRPLQFVRKVSGSNKPSKANAEAFERAVEEVAASTRKLLDSLVTNAPPKNREEEAAKRRAKYDERFAA